MIPDTARPRLETEIIGWLTTVSPAGRPQPSPVWFLLTDDEILIYSRPNTAKLRNIAANPTVSLHLDGDGMGGGIVILNGVGRVVADEPPSDKVPAYGEKYNAAIARNSWSPSSFAADYSVAIRISVSSARVW